MFHKKLPGCFSVISSKTFIHKTEKMKILTNVFSSNPVLHAVPPPPINQVCNMNPQDQTIASIHAVQAGNLRKHMKKADSGERQKQWIKCRFALLSSWSGLLSNYAMHLLPLYLRKHMKKAHKLREAQQIKCLAAPLACSPIMQFDSTNTVRQMQPIWKYPCYSGRQS